MGLMVVSSIAISFGGLVVRNIQHADSWQINFYRSIALTAAVAAILLLQYRTGVVHRVLRIGSPGIIGGLVLAAAGISFLESIRSTTVANTLFILSAIPCVTAALERVFLKEPLRRITIMTMFAAITGVLVIFAEGIGVGSIYGNAMAAAATVGFSVYAVIVRRYRRVDMLPTLLVSGLAIGVVSLLVRIDSLAVTWNDLLLCLLWGGLLSGLANWLFIVASRHLIVTEVTLFMLLEFAIAPIWVWLFADEVPSHLTLLGGTLVIASVASWAVLDLRPLHRA